jgi:hypothetical protein
MKAIAPCSRYRIACGASVSGYVRSTTVHVTTSRPR